MSEIEKSVLNKLEDPTRLEALNATGLLDSAAEEPFDRLTRLASLITDTPVSLVSLVDADRNFFKSACGLPEPLATGREAPLSHTVCMYVVADSSPLIVEDARVHPVLHDNGAVTDFGIVGYLGVPLQTSAGIDLGSFCIIDNKPRQWTEREIQIVRELAMSVMIEIELRAQVKARTETEQDLQARNRKYKRVYALADTTISHMKETLDRGADVTEIKVYLNEMQNELQGLKD